MSTFDHSDCDCAPWEWHDSGCESDNRNIRFRSQKEIEDAERQRSRKAQSEEGRNVVHVAKEQPKQFTVSQLRLRKLGKIWPRDTVLTKSHAECLRDFNWYIPWDWDRFFLLFSPEENPRVSVPVLAWESEARYEPYAWRLYDYPLHVWLSKDLQTVVKKGDKFVLASMEVRVVVWRGPKS